jgi:2-polyprenyl-6-methoxyphenol hydroxylase-like FAD-dependent oxidoreductase
MQAELQSLRLSLGNINTPERLSMYDTIVIGARCAGAPVAMLLAQKGYKVLLLDRSTFPSEIAHGHFIHRQGPMLLARWRLLNKIVESNCPPVLTRPLTMVTFP